MPEHPSTRSSVMEDFACIMLDAEHHSLYVHVGATCTRGPDMKLGGLLMVFDREGWATLHHIVGFSYQDGQRFAAFGPRDPWPDGTIAARKCPVAIPDDEDDAKDILRRSLMDGNPHQPEEETA